MHRSPVFARNVVATSQPLAAQAGLRMLLDGGNAVDAAIATAVALTVVEPTSNGIGGDLFALVWDGSKLHGLNASGRSPARCVPELFDREIPLRGWKSVTVPGAVSGWVALSGKFGKLPFSKLFEPAIAYAQDGYPVTPITADAWNRSVEVLHEFPDFLATFAPAGRAPTTGELFRSVDHARTLRSIADSAGEDFYRGELARKIVAASRNAGWIFELDDLASHHCDWVEPLALDYRGKTLHEIPPNGQGIAAQIALGMLRHFDLRSLPADSVDSIHLQIEAVKLALADAYRYISDPAHADIDPRALLDGAYLASRANLIDPKHAKIPLHGALKRGGTVLLCAADASGMMVTLIQSNYFGFGSGIVIPGTGIAMQNRGHGFTLERGHPNRIGPSKRPFHTIIPAFVSEGGKPLMSFGMMGGHMQAQGHVQLMTRIFDHDQNPQQASDAPRWRVDGDLDLLVEPGMSQEIVDGLKNRGHRTQMGEPGDFGGAQLIMKHEAGYEGASDHRKDGQAVGH